MINIQDLAGERRGGGDDQIGGAGEFCGIDGDGDDGLGRFVLDLALEQQQAFRSRGDEGHAAVAAGEQAGAGAAD